MSNFTWIPIYKEIASNLIEYKDRQDELLELIRKWSDIGLKTLSLSDKDENEQAIPLTEIDPFSFFANWNRGGDKNRLNILRELKKEWDLKSHLPEDFDGIPLSFTLLSWFFPYKKERAAEDVPKLWGLFIESVKHETISEDLYEYCSSIKGVKNRITTGLSWIRPSDYLSIDSTMRAFFDIHETNVVLGVKRVDFSTYKTVMTQVKEQ